ncbi:MAG: GTP-binding protein, partial [Bacteroidia bacterium]|nr:GTP-binding protein [Bacteroidia bacterium]
MSKRETPILLLTGYLGSGKTTLVNNILSNRKGIKFAVIVNDIGEVNIDATLIQKGGVVGKKDDSLVALQNGCICCTLKMDLVQQITDIIKMGRFDYIVIEASGICEPEPIARTISSIPQMGREYTKYGDARLDCIVTVVDALRMQSEFGCGDNLQRDNIGEEDIENLIIQQIEFCNIVLLNKASDVKHEELERIKLIIKNLQPDAEIIECDYGQIELDRILETYMFDYNQVSGSAGWIKIIEGRDEEHHDHDDDDDECECGCGHHHHHHDDDDDDDDDECDCGHHHHDHEHEHDHHDHEHEACGCGGHDHDHDHHDHEHEHEHESCGC